MKQIELTRGEYATVDDDDYSWLTNYNWYAHTSPNTCYAATRLRRRDGGYMNIRMHQLILRPQPGEVVDHMNGNGLDNRKCNLRTCSQAQNVRNSRARGVSIYKGVCSTPSGKWRARIWLNSKRSLWLGVFDSEVAAAAAYNNAALQLHGEYAKLNSIPNLSPSSL
jgi:hypothetical protein